MPGSVGRPFPFQHSPVRLARCDPYTGELERGPDGFLVECREGETGELLGKVGKGVMPHDGYKNPEENEEKIIRNAFQRGDVYFRTGDALHRDGNGYYYFSDRMGDTLPSLFPR